jgi:cell division protein FtsQ
MMPRKGSNRRHSAKKSVKREFSLPKFSLQWLKLRKLGQVALLLSVGVVSWSATSYLMDGPINSVRVEGHFERVPALQVEAAIGPYMHDGLLTADLVTVRQAIADLPWVQDVSVRRSWPSTLIVSLTEEQAAAQWGKDGLLNVYGHLFVEHATHIPAELPKLSGPQGTQLEVATRFFELDALLQQRGLNAVALGLDGRGAWSLKLSNGIEVRFGAAELAARTSRFFEAFDQVLASDAPKIDYIDMRYTNGFAVGWKSAAKLKLADTGEIDPHA